MPKDPEKPAMSGAVLLIGNYTHASQRAEAASLLAVAPGAPLLQAERVTYTYQDRPVEVRRGRYVTDFFHYRSALG